MPKLQPLPASVSNDKNQDILMFLQGKNAHSDVADVLIEASAPLGDVQLYSSEPANYGYIVLTTQDVVFAVAYGMSQIGFRLDETFKGRALETGGLNATEVGPDWVAFDLFRTNYPVVDLLFWARKAYLIARGADPS
ncbi:MAG: hypothetical protein OEV07_08075 [Gammaproteobacteria bacterium]|nr:hypothetical protein [Gammaproteobacteria bacterium]